MAELTEDERAELELLRIINEQGKFAVPIGSNILRDELLLALGRLQVREWVRLIDVTTLSEGSQHPNLPPNAIYRIFMATQPAKDWVKKFNN